MGVSDEIRHNSDLRIRSTRMSNRQGQKKKSGREKENRSYIKSPNHLFCPQIV